MADLSKVLGGPWVAPAEKYVAPPETQLRDAMLAAGLNPPDEIHFDGKIHRFRSGTKGSPGHGDKPGWYLVFGDGIPAGRFGCWRAGIEFPWRADVGRKLSDAEEVIQSRRVAEARELRDAELKRQQQMTADTVEKIWVSGCIAHEDHPYLRRKGIKTHGVRITGDGRLMAPLYDKDWKIASIQYIDKDGGKLYHPGGRTGGCFWFVGTMDDPGVLYIAEGFATAATIHEKTNRPCVVAYSASNLVPVTGVLREKYGLSQELVIVADNDASQTGQKYADQASAKYGARVVVIPIEGMDANDYDQSGNDLVTLLVPAKGDAIIKKLEAVFAEELGDEPHIYDELIEGILTIGGQAVLYGDSNSGKTFFALSMALSIATGRTFHGRQVDPGLVVYLASEAPASIMTRVQAIKRYHQCSLENLVIIPVPLNFYERGQDANDVIELVKAVEDRKGKPCRSIFADTLARMSAGANENSGEDMGPVMARFEAVSKATGAAMVTIHHNGKDAAKGARGWSGIRAHIDTEIEVIEKDGVRSATITKQRELPGKGDVLYFKLEIVEMGITKFGKPATTCVAVPDQDAQDQQPSNKKPPKQIEAMRVLERAWWDSACEERNGIPYVSRSAVRKFLVTNEGKAERTAENLTDKSRPNSLVFDLLQAGSIEAFEHGWLMVDHVQASAMMISKASRMGI